MKKLTMALMVLFCAASLYAGDKRIPASQLPAGAQILIERNFGKNAVNHVKMDKGMFSTEYDVVLNNGTELEFDKSGNLKSIDTGYTGIPKAMVPAKITEFVKQNYKGAKIVEMEIKGGKIEVELSNDVDLVFDSNGRYLGISD